MSSRTAQLRVLVTIGTRPELIKLAPIVHELQRRPDDFELRVMFTAQHRELLDQMARFFKIEAQVDLDAMTANQGLTDLSAKLLVGLDRELVSFEPDMVLAQGDTTTVMCTALACYHRKIAFGHVEAGLRTENKFSPFPEEGNRRLAGVLADLHFAPTVGSRDNLLRENVSEEVVIVTGNTVIDALQYTAAMDLPCPVELDPERNLVLMTVHRRESFGAGVRDIFKAVRRLCESRDDVQIVYPVHPNPNVQRVAREQLGDLDQVSLIDPLDYPAFVSLMKRARLILTDSGGVQEEAPSLGVPVLVLRETTERPEGVEAGCSKLVGTDVEAIFSEATRALDRIQDGAEGQAPANPYGDGKAAGRTVDAMLEFAERVGMRGATKVA